MWGKWIYSLTKFTNKDWQYLFCWLTKYTNKNHNVHVNGYVWLQAGDVMVMTEGVYRRIAIIWNLLVLVMGEKYKLLLTNQIIEFHSK